MSTCLICVTGKEYEPRPFETCRSSQFYQLLLLIAKLEGRRQRSSTRCIQSVLQDGYDCGPTQNCKSIENIECFMLLFCFLSQGLLCPRLVSNLLYR